MEKLAKSEKAISKEIKADSKKEKVKKIVKKQISKIPFLSRNNSYAHALLDPFNVHSVFTPDEDYQEACLFSATRRSTLTAGANGVCGNVYGICVQGSFPTYTPFGGLVPYNTGGGSNYTVGFTLPTGAQTTALINAAVTTISIPNFNLIQNTIPANFSRVKLVSWGVKVMYTGNALNAAGKLTLAYAPVGTLTNAVAGTTTFNLNQVLALKNVFVFPVASLMTKAAAIRWKPTDISDQAYVQVSTQVSYLPSGQPYPPGCAPCEIFLIADGVPVGGTFWLEEVWNFQAIPTTSTLNFVSTGVPKYDPISLAHAQNVIQELPAATLVPPVPSENMAAPETNIRHHEPTEQKPLFEQIMGPGGWVDKGLQVAETFTPMVKGLLSLL